MFIASGWKDYEVIDTGDGEKLERWQDVILRRPDPQAIWPKQRPELWTRADAHYHRSAKGGGEWEFFKKLPERWTVSYGELRFYVHPTGFKHTGLFPEQAVNWDWMAARIREAKRPIKVLNLFGYTGGATVACARAGAQVTHVDAARGMVQWAGENRRLSGIDETHVRWIVDDAKKFVLREARRGNAYQGILMDPPSYGRGPGGEVWKLENELYPLVEACEKVLAGDALFMLINSYTTGLQPAVLNNMLTMAVARHRGGRVTAEEIVLPVTAGGVLPCGATEDGVQFEFLDANGERLPDGATMSGQTAAQADGSLVQSGSLSAQSDLSQIAALRAFNCWTKERYESHELTLEP